MTDNFSFWYFTLKHHVGCAMREICLSSVLNLPVMTVVLSSVNVAAIKLFLNPRFKPLSKARHEVWYFFVRFCGAFSRAELLPRNIGRAACNGVLLRATNADFCEGWHGMIVSHDTHGGTNGLADRQALYRGACAAFGV
jgi:hypothetical protein